MRFKQMLASKTRGITLLAMAVAATALLIAVPGYTDEHNDDVFDLAEITCWELGGIEEAESRVAALMMVYGYVAGVHKIAEHNGKEVGPALEQVGKLCSTNPDMYVSSAIERVLLP